MSTECSCDPRHLEVGGYDRTCPIHDHPAVAFPAPHGRASASPLGFYLAPGLVLVAFAICFAVIR